MKVSAGMPDDIMSSVNIFADAAKAFTACKQRMMC